MDYDDIRRGDCPVMGEGLGHAWVSSLGPDDPTMGCTACHTTIPKPEPPTRSLLDTLRAWLRGRG